MEQTKALNALEPFLALTKTANSPRAAADLVTRVTSAPNTFLFTEILETSSIQALADSPEFAPYLTLLKIFSYGTYETYKATAGLPALNEAQTRKLRQLSLLSLASERSNLNYDALQTALGLSSSRELEDLVISAIYAGLLHATLDPARQSVIVSSVSPLRDLAPGSVPNMIAALKNWADRCVVTLGDLDEQMRLIRTAAITRAEDQRTADEKLRKLVADAQDADKKQDLPGSSRDILLRRAYQKRAMGEPGSAADETMDVDESYGADDAKKRASKRKL